MYIITTDIMRSIIDQIGIKNLISRIHTRLIQDLMEWNNFNCSPRYAHYIHEGVMEIMPIGNTNFFSFKYVNGHPGNVQNGFSSIMATGQLCDCHSGLPLLISEMTILTALRTAATTQLVAMYGAKQESSILAIIGNGSQSTFQTIAICEKFSIKRIQHYDIDKAAMQIYSAHIHALYPSIEVIGMNSSHEAARGADIIITVTEAFGKQEIISRRDIAAGAFIAGIGGDCPGKTELDEKIVTGADIIVEFETQTRVEGEIQWYPNKEIHSSIYELVQGKKIARKSSESIVLFDSVGFALEDYSALHVIYEIAKDFSTPKTSLIPENMSNLKDLYGYAINKGNDFFPSEN